MSFLSNLFGPPNIEKLEREKNVEKLLNLLQRGLQTTDDLEIRVKSAQALSRIADPRAVTPINDCIGEINTKKEEYFISRRLGLEFSPTDELLFALLIVAHKDLGNALLRLEENLKKK